MDKREIEALRYISLEDLDNIHRVFLGKNSDGYGYNYMDIPTYIRNKIERRKKKEKKRENVYTKVERDVNNLSHLRRIDPLFEDDPYKEVQMENIGAVQEREEIRQMDYE